MLRRWCPTKLLLALSAFCATSARGQGDITPPTAGPVTYLTSPNLDSRAGTKSLSLRVTITDDLAGANSVCLYFRSPSNQQNNRVGCFGPTAPFVPAQPQIWEGIVTFDPDNEAGNWVPYRLTAQDAVGNFRSYGAADPQLSSLPPVNLTSNNDTTPPTIVLVTRVTPASVDVTAADATIRINIDVSDAGAGVPGSPFAYLTNPASNTSQTRYPIQYAKLAESTVVVGGVAKIVSAKWQLTYTMPVYSAAGTWNLLGSQYDGAGNATSISSAAILQVNDSNPEQRPLAWTCWQCLLT